jgi:hypothetical protein
MSWKDAHGVWIMCVPSLVFVVGALGLKVHNIFPTDLNGPSGRLVRAARAGDLQTVRKCFIDHDRDDLDLDTALDAAAAHSHTGIVMFLVNLGAEDLDSALLSAVARDNVRIVTYLISKERHKPATNIELAQALASSVGAFNCDWILSAHRWNDLRSR